MSVDAQKCHLVTGGTKGIGYAIAQSLATSGTMLFLGYRSDEASAVKARAALQARGAKVFIVKEDVGTEKGANRLIAEISRHTSRLHGLVHSAALPNPGDLMTQDMGEIRQAIDVGGLALLFLVRAASSLFGQGSSVLFLSGASTDIVLPRHGALAAAKALGECLVRYLSIECAGRGINFNTIGSGPVDTDLFRAVRGAGTAPPPSTPIGRPLEPSDVGAVAAFLLSPQAFMVRGQNILVDGGLSTSVRTR